MSAASKKLLTSKNNPPRGAECMYQPVIAPAILATTLPDFERQLARVEGLVPYVHVDIMDGQFVPTQSFAEVEAVAHLHTKLPFELHLMVNEPLDYLERWADIGQVFRALIHVESNGVSAAIARARELSWQTGLVLNPETALTALDPFMKLVDVLQFMSVHPGRQGAPFVPAVLEKIKHFTTKNSYPHCAVDGAVSTGTIGALRAAGVEIFAVGSALSQAPDFRAALANLKAEIA